MTFLAPWVLAAAGAAAAVVVALHFLARQRLRPLLYPTARFVPDLPTRAVARAMRPVDLPLLALRVLAVLLAGAAFAHPVPAARQRTVARVVVLDHSASARDARGGAAARERGLGGAGARVPVRARGVGCRHARRACRMERPRATRARRGGDELGVGGAHRGGGRVA